MIPSMITVIKVSGIFRISMLIKTLTMVIALDNI